MGIFENHLQRDISADNVFRMMLNTSQNLDAWQEYFGTPSGSKLGLMNAIYQIGSLASFPFVYVIAISSTNILPG